VGIVLLALAHMLGLEDAQVYDATGTPRRVTRGRGQALERSAHGVLCVALVIALIKGIFQLGAIGFKQRN
jgi:hypothetical protein